MYDEISHDVMPVNIGGFTFYGSQILKNMTVLTMPKSPADVYQIPSSRLRNGFMVPNRFQKMDR